LLFNFALDNAIKRGSDKPGGLKLRSTHQLLVYADGVNILGRCVITVQKNKEA
jgi:hypothetical protein